MDKCVNTAPFNVKATVGNAPVTFTIMPEEKGLFKIVYFGGVLGAIKQANGKWVRVPDAQVPAGDLPPYRYKDDHGEESVSLVKDLVNEIGEAIATALA